MRTHTLLSLALLGLLAWASCIQANDAHADDNKTTEAETPVEIEETEEETEEESEKKPKKEKTTEIEEENDVMVLHNVNFARALSENPFLLVEFYAPWCGHCKRLEPEYAKAAQMLKEEGSKVRLAKVEATDEKELSEEFDIQGFPILKLFINGDRKQPIDYSGKRTAEGIIKWLRRRSGPATASLDTPDSAAKFIDAHKICVVGFFDSLDSEAAKAFVEVAQDMTDAEFAVTTNPEVFQKYEVKDSSVVLFKKFDEGRADFAVSKEGKLDKDELISFIKESSLELVITFSEETAEKIFTSNVHTHSLLFINVTVASQMALLDIFKTVAKEFKGKMLFVVIDVTATTSNVLNFFGVSGSNIPTARIINTDTGKKYTISGEVTGESLREFSRGVVEGTAEPYYRSEEIPEDWDKAPVKVLVGKNFEAVALDSTKNVFVKFYAPWCGHCKDLAPIWEKLAEKYADRDDIIIAKMDSTVNEVESVTIGGFPTLHYYPAGGKEVVLYTGKRDLETLSKFLDDGGVLPEKEKNDDDDDDDDDDGEDIDFDDLEEEDIEDEGTHTEEEEEPSKDEL